MDKAVVLQIAIHNHLELDIIYAGGSQPGTSCRTLPTAISGGIVKVRCQGAAKSFKVDLIQLPDSIHDQSFRNYTGIHDILLREQSAILASGLIPVADRFHLTLNAADTAKLSLSCSRGTWSVNGRSFSSFQAAAEQFIVALRLINGQLPNT